MAFQTSTKAAAAVHLDSIHHTDVKVMLWKGVDALELGNSQKTKCPMNWTLGALTKSLSLF